MAKEAKKPAPAVKTEPETRAKTAKAKAAKDKKTDNAPARKRRNPFRAIGAYFKGAWVELRQVRWPNRSATWGLTVAVILFSLFFAAIILGLDTAFSYLFKEILL